MQRIDRLLRRTMAGREAGTDVSCPEPELLAAFAERTLSGDEWREVERHASSCVRCARILALTMASEPVTTQSESPRSWWPVVRWSVPLATAATIAAIWFARPLPAPQEFRGRDVAVSDGAAPVSEPGERRADRQSETAESRSTTATAAPPPLPAPIAPPARSPERDVADEGRLARSAPSPASEAARKDADMRAAQSPAPRAETQANRGSAAGSQEREQAGGASAPAASARAMLDATRTPILASTTDGRVRWRMVDRVVERSTDEGASWLVEYVAPRAILAADAVDGEAAWAVGRAGLVLRRSEAGWEAVSAPAAGDVVAIDAATAREAAVTMEDGRRFVTEDEGETWR